VGNLTLLGLGASAVGTAGFFAGEKMAGAMAGVPVLGHPAVGLGLAGLGATTVVIDQLGILSGKKKG